MKNNKFLLIGAVVLLVVGGFISLRKKQTPSPQKTVQEAQQRPESKGKKSKITFSGEIKKEKKSFFSVSSSILFAGQEKSHQLFPLEIYQQLKF